MSADGGTVTIKDYAYDATANAGILTGDMGSVGLEGVPTEDKVHFKTMLSETVVNVTPDLLGTSISMIDMTGKEVKTVTIEELNTTVSHENLDSGIYMVVVNSEDGSVSKKVYVK